MQRDYFILWSWFYFSPFICDMRSRALLLGEDVVRYPSFAIVFGKSNCGKTTLVDTLMTSMFGKVNTCGQAQLHHQPTPGAATVLQAVPRGI